MATPNPTRPPKRKRIEFGGGSRISNKYADSDSSSVSAIMKAPIIRMEDQIQDATLSYLNHNGIKSLPNALIMQRPKDSMKDDYHMSNSAFDCGYYEFQNLSRKLASYALKSSEHCDIAIHHVSLALEELRLISTNRRCSSISRLQDARTGQVSIRVPDIVKTKDSGMSGCPKNGDEERYESQKELFASKPRQCQTCGMCDGHDSRNCPNKYAFPQKGEEKRYKSQQELWACKPRRCQTCGRCDGHDSRNCPAMYAFSKKGEEKQYKSQKEPWASKPRQCKTCGMCDGHDSRNCPTKIT